MLCTQLGLVSLEGDGSDPRSNNALSLGEPQLGLPEKTCMRLTQDLKGQRALVPEAPPLLIFNLLRRISNMKSIWFSHPWSSRRVASFSRRFITGRPGQKEKTTPSWLERRLGFFKNSGVLGWRGPGWGLRAPPPRGAGIQPALVRLGPARRSRGW